MSKKNPNPHSCENCKYYRPDHESASYGRCHFNPPVRTKYTSGDFPTVGETSWCGKYEEDKK